jgi:ABC-type polysaccharide/polyol phosphate export permease
VEGTEDGTVVLDVDNRPSGRRAWLSDMWRYRATLLALAQADFHVRYKRAALGVAWAVAVPVLQAGVLAIVFSRVIRTPTPDAFAGYVLAGVLAWSYFSLTLSTATTSIVDGSGLTDKVWFPRAVLVLVPCLANLVGLGVSLAAMLVILPLLGDPWLSTLVLLIPACVLLVAFTAALSLVLSGLQVYFRDVKFLVQAGLLIGFYLTPIAYPKHILGNLSGVLEINPLTGIVHMFQVAAVGAQPHWSRAALISLAATVVLTIIGAELQRRNDRLFVDLL